MRISFTNISFRRRHHAPSRRDKWANALHQINAKARLILTVAAGAVLFCPSARACGVLVSATLPFSAFVSPSFPPALQEGLLTLPAAQENDQSNSDRSSNHEHVPIVGMWTVNFFVQGKLWDVAIEQFYADGNEMTNDIAVPPSVGNICWGIWEKVSQNIYKLKHIGWTFDANGAYAGRFDLVAKLEVDPSSGRFHGHFIADQEDLSGNFIPALHAEGMLSGIRFKVD